jgi:hypothetical protein
MKVNYRFPKPLVWGCIALLLLAITACPTPSDPVPDPQSREKTEDPSEQKPGTEDEEGTDPDDGEEQKPGEEEDGDVFQDAREFSSVNDLKAYLDSLPENTATKPYPVKITGVDLSSKAADGSTMRTLYDALNKSNRFVSLHLGGCTGTELISASALPSLAGRKKIVSIVLPESITSVASNGFSGYEVLRSAVLPNVITIDYAAFNNLENLKTVSAPELSELKDSADGSLPGNGIFYKCVALTSIYFPKLETIGHHAFYDCSALKEVQLPKARVIGPSAFAECDALKTVELPEAGLIGSRAFYGDKSLEVLVLGSTPPVVEGSGNFASGYPKKIYVPTLAIDGYKDSEFWSKMKDWIFPLNS